LSPLAACNQTLQSLGKINATVRDIWKDVGVEHNRTRDKQTITYPTGAARIAAERALLDHLPKIRQLQGISDLVKAEISKSQRVMEELARGRGDITDVTAAWDLNITATRRLKSFACT
jgi:hypothetical protein